MLQLEQWYWVLSEESKEEEIVHEETNQLVQKSRTGVVPASERKSIALQYTGEVGSYHQNLSEGKEQHSSVRTHAVHLWKTSDLWEGVIGQLPYQCQDEIWTSTP